jgi:nitrate reductase assembly molybdenum cofactor insertion protein NarJ
MKNLAHYTTLANLFRYPDSNYHKNVNDCLQVIQKDYPEAAKKLQFFADFINSKDLFEVEEIFGKTFHIQAICFLDLGYVVFGEDFKRGEFLVHMKREQEKAGNDCGVELADNLPNALTLLTKGTDEEFTQDLGSRIVGPALRKMLEEFEAARVKLRERIHKRKNKVIILENLEGGNIYRNALQALLLVVESDFDEPEEEKHTLQPDFSKGFVSDCGSCSTVNELTKKSGT